MGEHPVSWGQWVTIEPAPASTYRGPFTTTTTTTTTPNKEAIKRETVGGTWSSSLPTKHLSTEIYSLMVLLLPSLDDGRPEDSGANASLLIITHAFWLQYRLTGENNPTPYPGAMLLEIHEAAARLVRRLQG
ncbi:uncharacterized protein BO72DRAFT_503021 [Aspergillus fijiensis CBS 313.89]|uniref:Uncharacterized protein n=1 Tax=Aspergillus fijiensis CBS 313.89 TaxID=1448319 RepID=A0A8G1RU37_9EURO|nr:uncharacterized protein BO72DRAFT_503021 [Aspergillus fijiensis CBS 313.89]RAK80152.1 hypothetical protein BO72DRAFT_503021 [Aspergillus fijiensis CBS 313.89]